MVDEAVTGVRVVKGFGQEDRELARPRRRRRRPVRVTRAPHPPAGALHADDAVDSGPRPGRRCSASAAGWPCTASISLGTFLAFSSYLVQLVAPVRMFAMLLAVGQQARAGAERILDILDANPMVTEKPDAPDLARGDGHVRFDDVTFGYTRERAGARRLHPRRRARRDRGARRRERLGQVDRRAAAPPLLRRRRGTITIDGVDVRDVTLDSLRRSVGVVFEDPFLFSDSVRANIAYGRPDATDDEIHAAATAAEADAFIRALPDGYDTVVGERGLTLSGGQRQRVALARALLTDPSVLVLDDATSSIDAKTEEEIHATLRHVMAGRTTILVAHRRSTLRLADRIVVVDEGRVVDKGTHEELDAALGAVPRAARGSRRRASTSVTGDGAAAADATTRRRHALGVAARGGRRTGRGPRPALGPPRIGGPGGGGGRRLGRLAGGHARAARRARQAAAGRRRPADRRRREASPTSRSACATSSRPYRRWLGARLRARCLRRHAHAARPVLVRYGIDHGVRHLDQRALWLATRGVRRRRRRSTGSRPSRYTLVTGRTAERLLYALRIRIFAHLQRLSLDYYDGEMAGRVMTRMTTDVDSLQQLLQTGLVSAIVSMATCVGVFVFLVVLSPPLALVAAASLPPLLLATWWYQRKSSVVYAEARDRIAAVNANFQESLSGVRVAQAYTREDKNIAGFRDVNSDYLASRVKAQKYISLYFPFVLLAGH